MQFFNTFLQRRSDEPCGFDLDGIRLPRAGERPRLRQSGLLNLIEFRKLMAEKPSRTLRGGDGEPEALAKKDRPVSCLLKLQGEPLVPNWRDPTPLSTPSFPNGLRPNSARQEPRCLFV